MPQIIEINDITIPELKPYTDTSELELKNSEIPMFIAESPKVIRTAIGAGYEPISLLTERKYIEGQAKDIIEKCGNCDEVNKDYIDINLFNEAEQAYIETEIL